MGDGQAAGDLQISGVCLCVALCVYVCVLGGMRERSEGLSTLWASLDGLD